MPTVLLKENWEVKDERLILDSVYPDFMAVIAAVNQIAAIAQELNHHPDLLVHDYKQLRITIYSHDSDTLTDRDYQLAQKIEQALFP
ncbi:4a-hydroxytetrahydrobiopterin dehydratase [Patescibacteria group bacterium]|nr:4a-hydroxytetrahydrobiopterin dehydratase [Patescibacteria group bacterium]